MIPVNPFHHPADLFAKNPTQRYWVAFYGDDVHAKLPERRRYLRTDKAHPYYHRSPPGGALCADAIAVVHRAQVVDALKVQARDSPRRYCLDSGGRSYGACGSAPISTTLPSKPS
jgi:predicted molibdopterin-dependent oxidoreductase YjgC